MSLTSSEFANTVRLVAVANTTATNDKTYNEFKAAVTTAFKKLVKDCRLPFIEYGDNKVRVLVASIGSVVYIVIPSHATAMEYEAQASSLGIVGLATAMLCVPEMDKVVLCGHGHGGGVAHVAHKQLESSNSAFKVASVAFGMATRLASRTTGSTFYTVYTSDDTEDATDASFDKLSKRPDVKDYSTQRFAATPTSNTEESQELHRQMMTIAPQHLASADLSKTMLPLQLARAVVAAVVTTRHGDTSIRTALSDVHGALKQFFASVKELGKKGNTKAELETIAANIEKTEEQWEALIEFLDGTQTTNESKMPWQALSDSEISLSELVRLTTMLLAVNIMRDEYGGFELLKDIAKPVLAIAATGALAVTGIGAVASIAALFTRLSLGAALGATAGAASVFVGSSIGIVATETSDFGHGFVALVRHCQSESYKEASSNYEHQLRKMARHAKIEEDGVDAITLQKKLAAIKDPKRTFRSERSIEFSNITGHYAELAADYIGVLSKLNELHSLTQQVRFVVLNGAQGVGKSWCIKSILNEELGPRDSTNEPIFMRYNPHGNPNSKVFLVDMPGDDSLSQNLLKQLVEFFGVASIGIQLFKFDTRPPQLDFSKVHNAFSGSDRVLVCLNQVLSVGADGSLAEYVDAWRCYLENNGIDVSRAESKYHLMATDLAGSNTVLRKRDAYDSDEEFDSYEGYTRRFAHSQRLGISRLRANGGHSRDDVVAWIDDAIAATGL